MSLSKLEDYVFLSDRNTQVNYIVERDGIVWKPTAFPEVYFVKNRQHNIVCNWQDFIKGRAHWRWRDGYLPVLEISDDQNLLELATDGDELLLRLNREKTFIPTENRDVSSGRFAELIARQENYWNKFFDSSWNPPLDDVFPDAAWRACFVQAINSFCRLHPKYGVGYYNSNFCDGFPPTIISMTDCLLDYEQYQLALDYLSYYLKRFVMPDGSLDFFGPAISEYGMILNLSGKISNTPSGKDWLTDHYAILRNIARFLYRLRNSFVDGDDNAYRLITGAPEADTRDRGAIYAHNNAWVWRGLKTWSDVTGRLGFIEASAESKQEADDLRNMLAKAFTDMPLSDGLPAFRFDCLNSIKSYDESRDASYANSRYYPELLQTGFLSPENAMKLIRAREQRNGELEGMTRFHHSVAWPDLNTADFCCNNWPIAAYAGALAELGEQKRFMRVLTSHFKYHQTHDTFTAYENVDAEITGTRRAFTDWCVPAQLVFPRLLRWGYRKFQVVENVE